MAIANKVKDFFHNEGIHSTTIQPEFIEDPPEMESADGCVLDCGNDKDCGARRCCPEDVRLRKFNQEKKTDGSSTDEIEEPVWDAIRTFSLKLAHPEVDQDNILKDLT